MTYRNLYEKAVRSLEKGEITCGEFDELTKPLDEEIRLHGEWIDVTEYCGEFRCSACNFLCVTNIYRFCPNCGADMRREGETE